MSLSLVGLLVTGDDCQLPESHGGKLLGCVLDRLLPGELLSHQKLGHWLFLYSASREQGYN